MLSRQGLMRRCFLLLALAVVAVGSAGAGPATRLVWSDASTNLLGAPSPDGKLISYVEPATGDLAVYEIASGRKRPLTRNPPDAETFAYFSVFSRDSSRLAYAWFNEQGFYEIWTVDVAGGKPKKLYSNPETGFVQPCDWSLDGKQILTLFFRKDNVSQIALVDAETGAARVLKTLSWFYPKKISFSPDGRFILYDSILGREESARDILLLDADGGAERKLIGHPADDNFPVWSPSGEQVVFASDRSGDMDLWRVEVRDGEAAGEPERIAHSVGRALPMGITRDGLYYYGLRAGRSDVMTAPRTGKGFGEASMAGLRSVGKNTAPAWSNDGKRLAFLTQLGTENYGRESRGVVVWVPSTRQESVLVPSLAVISQLRWSPDDSRLLASGSDGRGRSGLFAVDPDSGAATGLVRVHGGDPRGLEGAWLNDTAVAYIAADRGRIERYDLETRETAALWEAEPGVALHHLAASADGDWVVFGAGDTETARRVIAVRLEDGEQRLLLNLAGGGEATAVEIADGDAYVTVRQSRETAVWRLGLEGGPAETTTFPAGPRLSSQGAAAWVDSDQRSEIWALEGWAK